MGVSGPQPISHPWSKVLELVYVPDAKAEYLQFNWIGPPDGGTMTAFANRLTEFENSHPEAQRLVIDLRHNPGGDNTVLRPLLISLIRSRFNQRGNSPAPESFRNVLQTSAAKGTEEAWTAYQTYLSNPMHRYNKDQERTVNALGYNDLEQGDTAAALVLFRLNTRAQPDSANAWDSLGECFEAMKDAKDAVVAYQRSLQLDPSNEHAREALARKSQGAGTQQ